MDTVTPERRSENMRAIASKNTSPEIRVRKALHRRGIRFRLHVAGLPGRPDVVMQASRICVFVHGCFWHGCTRCVDGRRAVRSNHEFWTLKIDRNRRRDASQARRLRGAGWRVFVVWECQTARAQSLQRFVSRLVSARQAQLVSRG